MKLYFLFICLLITSLSFAQKGEIIKTEDGRRVLLKADYTWEYIDMETPNATLKIEENTKPTDENACQLDANFEEPKLDSKIQSKLKRGHSTIEYVKKKVAKDNSCTVDDVLLISFSEQLKKGVYHFCANGTKVTYKRVGNMIIKASSLF